MTSKVIDLSDKFAANTQSFPGEVSDPAGLLYGIQKAYGKEARKQSHAAYKTLITAHALLAGVIMRAMRRANRLITEVTTINEERNALFACYIIGMTTCEKAIEQARYLQAFALLRQEMETVAHLKTMKNDKRRKSKPDVFDSSIKRLYENLSTAVHASNSYIMRNFTSDDVSDASLGTLAGTRYFPMCDCETARRAFGLHLILTLEFITELRVDHSEIEGGEFTQDDINALSHANRLLIDEGILDSDTWLESF